MIDDSLKEYYAQRAPEYEDIYARPERQEDIASLRAILQGLLAGHDVLEVACGTGYWTLPISLVARSILATDVSEEVIQIARTKPYPGGKVRFRLADAFTLEGISGDFTAGFAGFWWSHMPKSKLPAFLDNFHRKLGPGALVVITDNNYVPDSSRPIARQDAEGNTYQLRTLKSGAEFEVIKNFPTETELRALLSGLAENVRFQNLTYYWCLSYTIATAGPQGGDRR